MVEADRDLAGAGETIDLGHILADFGVGKRETDPNQTLGNNSHGQLYG